MDWRAANEQQDETRWRVFLMFIIMALMVIRTGLVSRSVIAILPVENAAKDAVPAAKDQRTSPVILQHATLVLLCLAEAAGRLLIAKERTVWELMNQPLPGPTREHPLSVANLCEPPSRRLDTS